MQLSPLARVSTQPEAAGELTRWRRKGRCCPETARKAELGLLQDQKAHELWRGLREPGDLRGEGPRACCPPSVLTQQRPLVVRAAPCSSAEGPAPTEAQGLPAGCREGSCVPSQGPTAAAGAGLGPGDGRSAEGCGPRVKKTEHPTAGLPTRAGPGVCGGIPRLPPLEVPPPSGLLAGGGEKAAGGRNSEIFQAFPSPSPSLLKEQQGFLPAFQRTRESRKCPQTKSHFHSLAFSFPTNPAQQL